MFLFRMHSVGSVRPRPPTAANAVIRWWNNPGSNEAQQPSEPSEPSEPQTFQAPTEMEEDVVVIQEEEMVLIRKEQQQDPAPTAAAPVEHVALPEAQEAPQPKCTEPETTVSAPAPSKKKKQQKRR